MSVSESEKECPLCMEALDWDDLGFFPCSCGYQICRFCWHRLRTDENGLCPACRQAFPDIPVSFNPEISAEEAKKQKRRNKERRSNKDQVFKPQDLATLRVVQKNLVFVIGLSSRLTQEDLKKEFAHFGKIIKFVHNKSTAYITYSKPEEAIRAIRTLNASAAHESAVQQLQLQTQLTNGTTAPTLTTTTTMMTNGTLTTTVNGTSGLVVVTNNNNNTITNNNNSNTNLNGTSTATTTSVIPTTIASLNNTSSFINAMSVPVTPNRLKASLGTTKYCNHFLRSQQCPKVGECMYLHEIAEAEASFTKEQMQAGKHVEYEKKLMDSYLAKMNAREYDSTGHHNNQQQQQPPTSHSRQLSQSQQQHQQLPLAPTSISTAATTTVTPQPTLFQSQIQLQQSPQQQPTPPLQSSHQLPQQQQLQSQAQQHQLQQQLHHQLQLQQQQQQLQHQELQQQRQLLQQQQAPPSPSPPLPQQQQQQQQQQQLSVDTDSEDDGLDFDPISVSTSGLRDLIDQQIQQAKQLQLQNYIQQMNTNQALTNVLFQQHNRLNHLTQAATNGLLGNNALNGHHPQTIPNLAGTLNTSPTQQQQAVAWQNLNSWNNFLDRSGAFGFENTR